MELKDTINLMTSDNYADRFKAEYYQTVIRYYKLTTMMTKWGLGELKFIPTCPKEIYINQLSAMAEYLGILEQRAEIENIELDYVPNYF